MAYKGKRWLGYRRPPRPPSAPSPPPAASCAQLHWAVSLLCGSLALLLLWPLLQGNSALATLLEPGSAFAAAPPQPSPRPAAFTRTGPGVAVSAGGARASWAAGACNRVALLDNSSVPAFALLLDTAVEYVDIGFCLPGAPLDVAGPLDWLGFRRGEAWLFRKSGMYRTSGEGRAEGVLYGRAYGRGDAVTALRRSGTAIEFLVNGETQGVITLPLPGIPDNVVGCVSMCASIDKAVGGAVLSISAAALPASATPLPLLAPAPSSSCTASAGPSPPSSTISCSASFSSPPSPSLPSCAPPCLLPSCLPLRAQANCSLTGPRVAVVGADSVRGRVVHAALAARHAGGAACVTGLSLHPEPASLVLQDVAVFAVDFLPALESSKDTLPAALDSLFALIATLSPKQLIVLLSSASLAAGQGGAPLELDHPLNLTALTPADLALRALEEAALGAATGSSAPGIVVLRVGHLLGPGAGSPCLQPQENSPLAAVPCEALLEGRLRIPAPYEFVSVTSPADAARVVMLLAHRHTAGPLLPRALTIHAQSFFTTRGGWAAEFASRVKAPVLPQGGAGKWPLPEDPAPPFFSASGARLSNAQSAQLLCGAGLGDCLNASSYCCGAKGDVAEFLLGLAPSLCPALVGGTLSTPNVPRSLEVTPDDAACPICGGKGPALAAIPLPFSRLVDGPPPQVWVACSCGHAFAHPAPPGAGAVALPSERSDHASEVLALAEALRRTHAWGAPTAVLPGCGFATACHEYHAAFTAAGWRVSATPNASSNVAVLTHELVQSTSPLALLRQYAGMLREGEQGSALLVRAPQCGLMGSGQPAGVWGGAQGVFSGKSLEAAARAAGMLLAAFNVSTLPDGACLAILQPTSQSVGGAAVPGGTSAALLGREAAEGLGGGAPPAWAALRYATRLHATVHWLRNEVALLAASNYSVGCVGGFATPPTSSSLKSHSLGLALQAGALPQLSCAWTVPCNAMTGEAIFAAASADAKPLLALLLLDWDCTGEALQAAQLFSGAHGSPVAVLNPFPMAETLIVEPASPAGRVLHAMGGFPVWPPPDRDPAGPVWRGSAPPLSRRPVLGITHVRDEQWLMGGWILHHAHLFDALVCVDYLSADFTGAIFEALAPSSWDFRPPVGSQSDAENKNAMMAITEEEVEAIEAQHVGWWRVALTLGEFLVLHDMAALVSEWEEQNKEARVLYFHSVQLLDAGNARARPWDHDLPAALQRTTFFVERWAPLAGLPLADLSMPLRRAWSMYSRFMHRMDEGIGYVPGRHNLKWWSGPWETMGRAAAPPVLPVVAPRGFVLKFRYGPWPEMLEYRHQQMFSSGHPPDLVTRERNQLLSTAGLIDLRMAFLNFSGGRFPEDLGGVHRDWHTLYGNFGSEEPGACLIHPGEGGGGAPCGPLTD